jgi:hypothetical protein
MVVYLYVAIGTRNKYVNELKLKLKSLINIITIIEFWKQQ